MSLKPERLNFSVWKGATFRKVLTLHQGDETTPPKDLTGYTARMAIRSNNATLEELTTENGGITLGGADGTIALHLSDEDTAAATWKTGSYTLFLTNPGGDTDPLVFGTFSIKGN